MPSTDHDGKIDFAGAQQRLHAPLLLVVYRASGRSLPPNTGLLVGAVACGAAAPPLKASLARLPIGAARSC